MKLITQKNSPETDQMVKTMTDIIAAQLLADIIAKNPSDPKILLMLRDMLVLWNEKHPTPPLPTKSHGLFKNMKRSKK